jgi:CheY-like chemotaxis protein
MKVMIIEDNLVDLKLLAAVLEQDGQQTLALSSTEHALESVRSDLPDLILLDLNLNGRDGLSFVRELRASPDTREIPVVAITAHPLRFRTQDVLAAGCSACIIKPVNTRALSSQLHSIAAQRLQR